MMYQTLGTRDLPRFTRYYAQPTSGSGKLAEFLVEESHASGQELLRFVLSSVADEALPDAEQAVIGNKFNFDLHDALRERDGWALQGPLLEAAAALFGRLVQRNPQSADFARDLSVTLCHSRAVTACAVSNDGCRVASWASRVGYVDDDEEVLVGELKEWDEDTNTEKDRSEASLAHETEVNWCTFLPDGHRHVSRGIDGTVALWASDAWRILTSADVKNMNLWDPHEGCGVTVEGEAGFQVTCRACSRDRRSFIRGAFDGRLGIWEHATGAFIGFLRGHSGPVLWCAYAPDGRHILSTSVDGTFRVWNVANLKEVAMFAITGVSCFAASPVSATFAIGTQAGRLLLLELEEP